MKLNKINIMYIYIYTHIYPHTHMHKNTNLCSVHLHVLYVCDGARWVDMHIINAVGFAMEACFRHWRLLRLFFSITILTLFLRIASLHLTIMTF